MLLRALFVLVLFAALSETIVHGAHALAQTLLRREASLAVREQLAAATAQARESIAGAIAGGADPRDVIPAAPSPTAACAIATATGCALQAEVVISFSVPSAATPSPCPSDGCTVYEQGNDAVTEGRAIADVSAEALSADGTILASRDQRLTFRTWRVAPYAALTGTLDVLYENQRTGATMPANVWHPEIQWQAVTPPAWSP
jgi:hypothetical protein